MIQMKMKMKINYILKDFIYMGKSMEKEKNIRLENWNMKVIIYIIKNMEKEKNMLMKINWDLKENFYMIFLGMEKSINMKIIF